MMSQGGKTAGAVNVALARLDDDPAKILYIGPTKTNVTKVIFPKIDEALRSAPNLWEKVTKGQRYTSTKILVAGVSFRLAWAGSVVELTADDACLVLIDEIDRMDRSIGGQGSVIDLGDARHGTYLDGKTVIFSTPTEGSIETEVNPLTGLTHWKVADPDEVGSQIWAFWQSGTRHECAVPCAECHAYYIPRMSLLDFPEGCTASEAGQVARVVCPGCGAALTSDQIRWSIPWCVYIAPGQRPLDYKVGDTGARLVDFTADPKGSVVHSVEFGNYSLPAGIISEDGTFWVSGLLNFAPKNTVARLARQLVQAQRSGDPERVKSVVNTKFGECFTFAGDAPKWELVRDRCANYVEGGALPDIDEDLPIITVGVDVQMRFLSYVVRMWRRDLSSWLLEHGELFGDTKQPEVWNKLTDLLNSQWGGHPVSRCALDSGYNTNECYRYQRGNPGVVIVTKGRNKSDKPFWPSKVEIDLDNKPIKGGQEIWLFNADIMKSWVHSRITWPDGEAGAWHLPKDISDDYCKEIVAEYRVIRTGTWVRTGPNHKLDCEALAYLAIRTIGGRDRAMGVNPELPETKKAPIAPRRTGRRTISRGVEV